MVSEILSYVRVGAVESIDRPAIMHGSSFTADCARALDDLDVALRELFGPQK
jgi:hypothetical protein